MAGTSPLLKRLTDVLHGIDDEALVSLANRGLLRRAQKDLESATPTILAVETDRVRLQLSEAIVEVPELPIRSSCSCPATGVCRHILAALLYLRDSVDVMESESPEQGQQIVSAGMAESTAPELAAAGVSAETNTNETKTAAETTAEESVTDDAAQTGALVPAPADVLGNLSDEVLQKWSSKPTFRKAEKLLAANVPFEIESSESFLVRFPTHNIACRWIPSGGLLGMHCSCQAENVCEHLVAAILAYQVSLGKRQRSVPQASLTESKGAPRTRSEVLASVGVMLREMMVLGLARLSSATAQRLLTLAVSAHGVDLPRMESALKTLADEVRLALRRDAQASSTNLVAQAARLEALRTALENSTAAEFVGQHRTQYYEVGQITLRGLGAQRWQSKNGYQGLTVLFWDESRNDWATWSDTRPVGLPGFNPERRFRMEGPWGGCESPDEAARSILQLSRVSRNLQGRLSGRSSTQALVLGATQPRDVPAMLTKWTQLAERAQRAFGCGLAERRENADLVLLAPMSWGPPHYDTLRQALVRPVADEVGRLVNLWLPFSTENAAGIDFLEQNLPTAAYGLLGAVRLVSGQVCIEPISLYAADKFVHLTLLPAKPRRGGAGRGKKAKKAKSGGPEPTPDSQVSDGLGADGMGADGTGLQIPSVSITTPLGRILVTVHAELEALVEGGIAAQRNVDLLQSAHKRLEVLGLTTCARSLGILLQALRAAPGRGEAEAWNHAAGALLHAYYVTQLASDFEVISVACQGLK
jgi:uncharacterized Zn finger protein